MSSNASLESVAHPQFPNWFQERHPKIPMRSAIAVMALAAEGSTVPFIARYRKEQTGNLDEVGVQNVLDAQEKFGDIVKRQTFILGEIEHQKKLTPELKDKIAACFELDLLEDIYLPYKKKRKTKATIAKEAGLEPLAQWIWDCGHGDAKPEPGQTLDLWAFTFRTTDPKAEHQFTDAEATIEGAREILTEKLAEMQDLRQFVRKQTFEKGSLRTGKGAKAKPNSKFENYFEYNETVENLLQPQNSHRYLAIRRGWMEEELSLNIGAKSPEDTAYDADLLRAFENVACAVHDITASPGTPVLLKAARLALKAHVLPSIENEVHKALKEIADQAAIEVFADNIGKLLLASPYGPKAVVGIDPGVRTGCKVAVVDSSGKYLASTVIQLHRDDKDREAAAHLLREVVKNAQIQAIAVGNGTAGREAETFIRKAMKEAELNVPVVMVSESGASVYSASDAAREEFPDLDLTVRGAISIARRLQDPLAELVKVDPKSIGVGQYQHDIAPHSLKKSLDNVVDRCVNSVGVNLNTASYHLLAHVSGIGPSLAKSIVEFRGTKGLFKNRTQLLEVPRFSAKAFEQAAGFLRIPDGDQPLDNTGVHPERYPLLEAVAGRLSKSVRDLMGSGVTLVKQDKKLREEAGEFTFKDIVSELEKPGRDPRDAFQLFQYREDVHEVKDLKSGMICPGIVTNVTNFGAFVDIGVHQDGLVHISQLSGTYVKDPRTVVSAGDKVQVRVLEVNLEKNQIALSMKSPEAEGRARSSEPRSERRPPPQKGASASHRPPGSGPSKGGPSPITVGGPKSAAASPRMAPSGKTPPVRPAQAFNNPFASLATLKKELRK